MIELFDRIKLFNNKDLSILIRNNAFEDFLQDYINFIAKQNNSKSYNIVFGDIENGDECAQFNSDKKVIILDKKIFQDYQSYITSNDISKEDELFVKKYPM
jgi:hypothetical protein